MRYSKAIASVLPLLACPWLAAGPTTPASQGERIYKTGTLISGERLQAQVQGDVRISGEQIICAHCHRISGYGSSESGRRIPSVTARDLFAPKVITHKGLYANRTAGAGTRPAYTEATLARTIRAGIDPTGRPLDPTMPRFQLPPKDMQALIAYLQTLSLHDDPGVDEQELHIATLIGPRVDDHRRGALLRLLEAFLEIKNAGTRGETRRARHTPFQKESSYPAYRRWVLHPWQLEGPAEGWPEQLRQHNAQTPVFAVVGGVVDGDFQPVADFCNAERLPCLFPTSDQPATEPGFYTIHFDAGRDLQARALARYLTENGRLGELASLLQIYRPMAASGMRTLQERLAGEPGLENYPLEGVSDATFWSGLPTHQALVAWLRPEDLQALAGLPDHWPERLYLQSTTELAGLEKLPRGLRQRIRLLHPYALPEAAASQRLRVKVWLQARGLSFDAPRVQLDAYFALTLFNDIMRHLGVYFSRDYAIETIEHMIDSALATSLYPHLSLAPGQRYASKGCYVTRLDDSSEGGLIAVSDWIVP